MTILAFDTATPATVVGLMADRTGGAVPTDGFLAPAKIRAREQRQDPSATRPEHTTLLLTLIEEVIREGGGWDEVERIGVGVGPGSFTGLRIGIATARALAQARKLPLVGVSTLQALALGAGEQQRPVVAVIDARRGEAFVAAWSAAGEQLLAPAALAPDALAERVRAIPQIPLAVGDGSVRFREELEAAGAEVPADSSPLHHVQAGPLCRLAAAAAETPAGTVLPEYLRRPDAELR
jgi:tRNA threonylcarbamoyladenosine biosynthesis protein TsaB